MTQPISPDLQAAISAGQVDPEAPAPSAMPAPEAPQLQQYKLPDGTVEYMDPMAATIRGAGLASQSDIAQDDHARRLLQQIQGEGFMGTLGAAGEGFVGGLLPGGIDLLRAGMTSEERELAAARAKQHNLVTGAGELLGMAAQHIGITALTGGAGEAANVGARAAAATASLGERVLAHGVKSVARGSLAGGQMTFNEESRENLDHDAERIAHGALIGAVLEPVLGIPLGLAADRKLARAIVAELGESVTQVEADVLAKPGVALDHTAQVVANAMDRDVVIPTLNIHAAPLEGMAERVLRKIPSEVPTSAGDKAIASEAVSGSMVGREYKVLAQNAEDIANKSAVASTTAQELGIKNTEKLLQSEEFLDLGKLVNKEAAPAIDQFGQEVVQDLNKAFQDIIEESGSTPGEWNKISKHLPALRDQYRKFFDTVQAGTAAEKAQAVNRIRQQLGAALSQLGRDSERAADPTQRYLASRFMEPIREIQQKIETAQRNPSIFGERYANAVTDVHKAISELIGREKAMRDAGLFTREGESALDTYKTKRGFDAGKMRSVLRDPTDPAHYKQAELIFGAAGGNEAAGKSYLQLATDLSEAFSKHFSNPEARVMTEQLLAANYLTQSLKGMTGKAWLAKQSIDAASRGSGQIFSEGAARLGMATLANVTLGPWAVPAAYAAGGSMGHLLNYSKRLNSLSAVENMLDKAAKRQQAGIVDFVAQRGVKPGQPVITVDKSGNILSAFRSMAANPAQITEEVNKLTQSVSTYAPKLAGMAAQKVAQVVSYINERVPPPVMATNLMQPQLAKQKPYPPSELQKINRMLTAAFRPESILTHPSMEGSQLVKDLYPNDYAAIQMGIIEHVSALKTPLPFTVRQQMALYFELPSDTLTDPKKYVQLQEMLGKASKQSQKAQARPIPIDISDSFKTMTQRIEGS
jgi:hypothetical protein